MPVLCYYLDLLTEWISHKFSDRIMHFHLLWNRVSVLVICLGFPDGLFYGWLFLDLRRD